VNTNSTDISALVRAVVALLADERHSKQEVESRTRRLVSTPAEARRLIDFIPEAFGIVLISHVRGCEDVALPTEFSAKAHDGEWRKIPFSAEPIFIEAVAVAQEIYHQGPRATMARVASMSALLDVVNKALNDGVSLSGARLGGPSMLGVSAELYQ
jgi:hypothetical protein